MVETMQETADRIREIVESPGERFVGSDLYRRMEEEALFQGETPLALKGFTSRARLQLLSAEQFQRAVLHAAAVIPPRLHPQVQAQIKPTPARIPALVNFVPVEGTLVRAARETSRTEGAGGSTVGSASPETVINMEARELNLVPWGTHLNAPRAVFRDRGTAADVIDRFVRDVTTKELERQMLVGDGSEAAGLHQFTGVMNTSGIGSIAKGADFRIEALAKGAELVQLADHFLNPIDIAIHPTDLREAVFEKNANNEYVWDSQLLEDQGVRFIVPTRALTAGTAVLGDFAGASDFFVEGGDAGWVIEMSDKIGTQFLARVMTLQVTNYAYFDVWDPGGFAKVTGL